MFYRSVPSNSVASCMIIVIDSRNYYKLKVEISTPSINILPSIASKIRNKVKVMVDLPAPINQLRNDTRSSDHPHLRLRFNFEGQVTERFG